MGCVEGAEGREGDGGVEGKEGDVVTEEWGRDWPDWDHR